MSDLGPSPLAIQTAADIAAAVKPQPTCADPRVVEDGRGFAERPVLGSFSGQGDRNRKRLLELERDRVPYHFRGLPVLVPRCAHDEIERLKAENAELRQQRNRLVEG